MIIDRKWMFELIISFSYHDNSTWIMPK